MTREEARVVIDGMAAFGAMRTGLATALVGRAEITEDEARQLFERLAAEAGLTLGAAQRLMAMTADERVRLIKRAARKFRIDRPAIENFAAMEKAYETVERQAEATLPRLYAAWRGASFNPSP